MQLGHFRRKGSGGRPGMHYPKEGPEATLHADRVREGFASDDMKPPSLRRRRDTTVDTAEGGKAKKEEGKEGPSSSSPRGGLLGILNKAADDVVVVKDEMTEEARKRKERKRRKTKKLNAQKSKSQFFELMAIEFKADVGSEGHEPFTSNEVEAVIKFMDPNDDGSIELDELNLAFRRSRRAKAVAADERQGRMLFQKLVHTINENGFTLRRWFEGVSGNDGKITTTEFKRGLHCLELDPSFRDSLKEAKARGREEEQPPGGVVDRERHHSVSLAGNMAALAAAKMIKRKLQGNRYFDETEIDLIIKFADVSGDGEMSIEEFMDAFRRSEAPSALEKIEQSVGPVLRKLEDLMKRRNIRLQDLFRAIDADDSGDVTPDELRDAFASLTGTRKPTTKQQVVQEWVQESEDESKFFDEAQKALVQPSHSDMSGCWVRDHPGRRFALAEVEKLASLGAQFPACGQNAKFKEMLDYVRELQALSRRWYKKEFKGPFVLSAAVDIHLNEWHLGTATVNALHACVWNAKSKSREALQAVVAADGSKERARQESATRMIQARVRGRSTRAKLLAGKREARQNTAEKNKHNVEADEAARKQLQELERSNRGTVERLINEAFEWFIPQKVKMEMQRGNDTLHFDPSEIELREETREGGWVLMTAVDLSGKTSKDALYSVVFDAMVSGANPDNAFGWRLTGGGGEWSGGEAIPIGEGLYNNGLAGTSLADAHDWRSFVLKLRLQGCRFVELWLKSCTTKGWATNSKQNMLRIQNFAVLCEKTWRSTKIADPKHQNRPPKQKGDDEKKAKKRKLKAGNAKAAFGGSNDDEEDDDERLPSEALLERSTRKIQAIFRSRTARKGLSAQVTRIQCIKDLIRTVDERTAPQRSGTPPPQCTCRPCRAKIKRREAQKQATIDAARHQKFIERESHKRWAAEHSRTNSPAAASDCGGDGDDCNVDEQQETHSPMQDVSNNPLARPSSSSSHQVHERPKSACWYMMRKRGGDDARYGSSLSGNGEARPQSAMLATLATTMVAPPGESSEINHRQIYVQHRQRSRPQSAPPVRRLDPKTPIIRRDVDAPTKNIRTPRRPETATAASQGSPSWLVADGDGSRSRRPVSSSAAVEPTAFKLVATGKLKPELAPGERPKSAFPGCSSLHVHGHRASSAKAPKRRITPSVVEKSSSRGQSAGRLSSSLLRATLLRDLTRSNSGRQLRARQGRQQEIWRKDRQAKELCSTYEAAFETSWRRNQAATLSERDQHEQLLNMVRQTIAKRDVRREGTKMLMEARAQEKENERLEKARLQLLAEADELAAISTSKKTKKRRKTLRAKGAGRRRASMKPTNSPKTLSILSCAASSSASTRGVASKRRNSVI